MFRKSADNKAGMFTSKRLLVLAYFQTINGGWTKIEQLANSFESNVFRNIPYRPSPAH